VRSDQQPHVSGRVDAQGRLIAADPRLLALQAQAGGVAGGVLAIPKLATIVRMAQTLGVPVSRNVIAATQDSDVELIVQATPDNGEIMLDIGGWSNLSTIASKFSPGELHAAIEWVWECDDALKMTGLRWDSVQQPQLGLGLTQVFSFFADEDGHFPFIDALAVRQPFYRQPADVVGQGVAVCVAGLPVIDSAGRYHGWRGVATSRAQPQQDRQTAPDRLTPHGARIDTSAALRAPLEIIVTQADDIVARREGEVAQRYVDYATDIAAAGRHLLGLVDDLSDAQSIESPEFHVDTSPVDLAEAARLAANLLAVRAADQNIRIDVPVESDRLMAAGDFRRILQILVNLIGNAVRYSPPGGVIWVRTEQEGDLAAIVVADQGKGIAGNQHQHIFEKFARLDKSELGGSGLGLYISRKLARAMSGDISVDSAPGQGARFILTLPVVGLSLR
jgi:hypothetical protein